MAPILVPKRGNGTTVRNDQTKTKLETSRTNTKSFHSTSSMWSSWQSQCSNGLQQLHTLLPATHIVTCLSQLHIVPTAFPGEHYGPDRANILGSPWQRGLCFQSITYWPLRVPLQAIQHSILYLASGVCLMFGADLCDPITLDISRL